MAEFIYGVQTRNRLESTIVIFLVWVAGSVDAISYMGLGHVFTANMTGNIVLLGLSLGEGNAAAAQRSVLALAGFCAGVVAGAFIVERKRTMPGWTTALITALCIELAVLAGLTAAWHFSHDGQHQGLVLYLLILLASAAMGIQATAVQHLKLPGIPTIVITTTLTTFITGLVVRTNSCDDEQRVPDAPVRWNQGTIILQFLACAVYCCSAVFSGMLHHWQPSLVVLPSLIALAVVLAGAFVLTQGQKRQA